MTHGRHHRRVWRLVLTGAAAAFILGFAALAAFTRTGWGRDRVRTVVLGAVGGSVNGSLNFQRLEGNLLTGARVHGIELLGADGDTVLTADSAYINYELPSFFGGDVVLNGLVLYGSEVTLSRLPTDSLWNYQELLLDTTNAGGAGRATVVESARLVDSHITLLLPWEPRADGTDAEQEAEIREVLADESRLNVYAVEGGYLREMAFRVGEGRVTDLVIAGEERGGTYLEIDTLTMFGRLFRGDSLEVRHAAGLISLESGVMKYDFPRVVLPSSTISSSGTVNLAEEGPVYNLRITGEQVDLADMRWIYPDVPDGGAAQFQLDLETDAEGERTHYIVRNLVFTAPGTRLEGEFALLVNGGLEFTEVNLEAAPFRVETIEEMLPDGLPVRGLQIGSFEIRSSGEERQL